jgi:hypothetical protein
MQLTKPILTCDHAADFFTSPEGWKEMTPEQRLDRAERILIRMATAGRRTRSEWRYKINSLIDAQIRHEAESRIRSARIDEQLSENRKGMAELRESIAELRESQKESIAELRDSQKLTDKALRSLIENLHKNRNGNSD